LICGTVIKLSVTAAILHGLNDGAADAGALQVDDCLWRGVEIAAVRPDFVADRAFVDPVVCHIDDIRIRYGPRLKDSPILFIGGLPLGIIAFFGGVFGIANQTTCGQACEGSHSRAGAGISQLLPDNCPERRAAGASDNGPLLGVIHIRTAQAGSGEDHPHGNPLDQIIDDRHG